MSNNQAATVDVLKDRGEFIQILEAGLGECKWRFSKYYEKKDCEEWLGDRGNKSAKFKVFAFKGSARWEFLAYFLPDKIKSDFRKELENAEWQGTDKINWIDESGERDAHISKNIGEKKYEFVIGVSGKVGKTTSQDQAEKSGYFCIKPVIDGIRQNSTLPFDEAITVFNKFSENIENSGIDQIFDDFFGEEDEKKRGRAKKPNNQNNNNRPTVSSPSESRQIIYFGAPGTSKSYTLQEDAEKIANKERVTFYPGYSYQQFVGTYKPCMVKSKDEDKGEGKIAYKFVPGPLLRLLEKALKAEKKGVAQQQDSSTADQQNDPEKFLLIVEELNRAEAAAVFGDLFQLLDRNSDGESEYPISVSEDLKQYLRRNNGNDVGVWENEPEDTQKKLSFPSNFYIWATMNSADQGVFPLDTAFKRRWDFKYFGIDDAADKLTNDKQKFWNELRQTINKALQKKLNLNEDKLLGPFFMKVEENIVEQTFWQRFCSKVLLYLYEDAARLKRSQIFKDKTYSEIYNAFKEIKSEETLQKTWNEVFFFECKPAGNYPWPKAETEEDTSSASQAMNNETAGETETENSGETIDEQ